MSEYTKLLFQRSIIPIGSILGYFSKRSSGSTSFAWKIVIRRGTSRFYSTSIASAQN